MVAEKFWEAVETHLADTYIGCIQGTVAQLVALRPIFEIYAREKGCNGDDGVARGTHGGIKRRQRLSSR